MTKQEEKEQQEEQNKQSMLVIILFLLPFILIGLLGIFLARWVVTYGAKFATASFLTWPLAYLITQVFGGMVFWASTLIMGFLLAFGNHHHEFIEYMSNSWCVTDLMMLPFFARIWGTHDPFTTIWWHIALYQVVQYLILGRIVQRDLTIGLYDSALQTIASRRGVHPKVVRLERLRIDPEYASANATFEKRGKWPLVSTVLVMAVGTNPAYYF